MEKPAWQILVVAESPTDAQQLRAMLLEAGGPGVVVRWSRGGAAGKDALARGDCDAVLVSRDSCLDDGLALLREAAHQGSRALVFLLVGDDMNPGQIAELDAAALEAGAAGLLSWRELALGTLWRAIRYAAHAREAGLAQVRTGHLELLLKHMHDEVWFSDLDGNLILLNPQTARRMGFEDGEKLNRSGIQHLQDMLQVEYLDGRPRAMEEGPLSRSLKGEVVRGQETIRHLKTGQPIYREFISNPIYNRDGQVSGAIAVVRDITEQKLAEQALHASEQKYRALVESLQEGIWLVDENRQTNFVNQHMADMLGYSVVEMIGQSLEKFLPADDLRRLSTECTRRQVNQPGQFECRFLHKSGGTRDVLVATNPLYNEQGEFRGAILGVIDITDRKLILSALEEREAQARRYAEELERSNYDLEQFAFIASHDLQEPLRKVKGFGERLETRYGDVLDEVGRDYLARMTSAAERMQRMIRDLLAFSRVSTRGKPFRPVDLNDVAAEVISDLELRIQSSGAQVALDDLPVVEADSTQMYQLLQNLLNNALKFSKKKVPPRVRVTARLLQNEGGREQVEIVVADDGIGFPMSQAERIFQPFQRLHGRTQYEGSGIGLAICRKIIERHGGSIRAESQPGQGSRFFVVLPVGGRAGSTGTAVSS